MGKRRRNLQEKLETFEGKKPFNKKYFLLGLLVLTISVFIFLLFLSFTNLSTKVLPGNLGYFLDAQVTRIPFLPLTSQQILSRAFLENENLRSYKLESFLKLEGPSSPLVDLKAQGNVEEGSKSSLHISGKTFIGSENSLDFQVKELGSQLFVKLDKYPQIPQLNLDTLGGSWKNIDLKVFHESLSVKPRTDNEVLQDVRSYWASNGKKLLLENNVGTKVKSFVSKGSVYEISFELPENALANLLQQGESFSAKNTFLTLYIVKSSFYITSVSIISDVVEKSGVCGSELLKFNFVYSLGEINQNQVVDYPDEYEKISNPTELALKLQTFQASEANPIIDLQVRGVGENFLTIERLHKVFLLLPKAL